MMSNIEMMKKIAILAESDGRYKKEGLLFLLAALEYVVSKLPQRRHLTGQELSRGIAEYARNQYGYMAKMVLESWGIYETQDFGEMVYLMIDNGLMNKTEEDKKEDFADVYDFDDEFTWEKLKPNDFPERF